MPGHRRRARRSTRREWDRPRSVLLPPTHKGDLSFEIPDPLCHRTFRRSGVLSACLGVRLGCCKPRGLLVQALIPGRDLCPRLRGKIIPLSGGSLLKGHPEFGNLPLQGLLLNGKVVARLRCDSDTLCLHGRAGLCCHRGALCLDRIESLLSQTRLVQRRGFSRGALL